MDEWLSTTEAADVIGVPLRRLYRLIDEGAVPAYKFGRVIRLRRVDVDLYRAGGSAPGDPPPS